MNLEELKALCEDATPGPWEGRELPELISNSTSTIHAPNATDVPTWSELPPEIAGVLKESDAHFIAAARTALPKLITAVEEILSISPDCIAEGEELNPDNDSNDNFDEGFWAGMDRAFELIYGVINNALEES